MDTGLRDVGAGLVRAASAASRLANVVRCARVLPTDSVVCSDRNFFIGRQAESRGAVRAESVSTKSAPVCSRDALPLPFHDRAGASTNWRVVETPGTWRVSAGRFTGRCALRNDEVERVLRNALVRMGRSRICLASSSEKPIHLEPDCGANI